MNRTLPSFAKHWCGFSLFELRFGKILEDRIYEDTAKLDRALAAIAAHTGAN